MGSLQCIGALISHLPIPMKKILIYVSVTVNGHVVRALLDIKTTNNFILEDEAKHLGLKMTKEKGTIKAINSHAKPIAGTAQGVYVTLGTWSEKLNFAIMPMDAFNMVLGMKLPK